MLRDAARRLSVSDSQGVNSIDIKNIEHVFGQIFVDVSMAIHFEFHMSGQFSGQNSGKKLCQLN